MISRKIVLKFPSRLLEEPITYKLVKDYDLQFNILKAFVTPKQEGLLVIELKGSENNYNEGIRYLKKLGITVQTVTQDIIRNEKRCTHCGACITICPSKALVLDLKTRKVDFYSDKCIACELCITACPPRAMEVHF